MQTKTIFFCRIGIFFNIWSSLVMTRHIHPYLRCRSSPRSRSALARAAAAFSASETPPGSPPSPFPWQTPWRMVQATRLLFRNIKPPSSVNFIKSQIYSGFSCNLRFQIRVSFNILKASTCLFIFFWNVVFLLPCRQTTSRILSSAGTVDSKYDPTMIDC